jgi:hypothetical protein
MNLVALVLGIEQYQLRNYLKLFGFNRVYREKRAPKWELWEYTPPVETIRQTFAELVFFSVSDRVSENRYMYIGDLPGRTFTPSHPRGFRNRARFLEILTLLKHLQGRVHPLCISLLREKFQEYYHDFGFIIRLFT